MNEIPIVNSEDIQREAYEMGYDRFAGSHTEIEDPETFDMSPFHDSAEWCNNLLPSLRAMSGYEDGMGHGTYTTVREVAVTACGLEDKPHTADVMDSHYVLEMLVDQFHSGAYDAVENNDKFERFELLD